MNFLLLAPPVTAGPFLCALPARSSALTARPPSRHSAATDEIRNHGGPMSEVSQMSVKLPAPLREYVLCVGGGRDWLPRDREASTPLSVEVSAASSLNRQLVG